MANLVIKVDKNIGNYEDEFKYRIDGSFSGIEGDINSAKIEFFVPSFIEMDFSTITGVSITENNVSDGRNVTLDFGKITDLGVGFSFGFGAWFAVGTPVGSEYDLNGKVIINGEEVTAKNAGVIKLFATSDYKITREIILPQINPAVGGEIYIKVLLENFGDQGVPINDITINCLESEFLDIDETYIIKGKDVSSGNFSDKSANEIIGEVQNNSVIFDIPSYFGKKYEFIYKAIISNDATDNFSFNAEFYSEDALINNHVLEISLSEPVFNTSVSLFVPSFTIENEYVSMELSTANTGNQALTNVELTKELSPLISYKNIKTGKFYYDKINESLNEEYFINYTSVNGVLGRFGPFNTSVNSTVSLENILSDGDEYKTLTWAIPNFYVGIKTQNSPHINGIVKGDLSQNISQSLKVITNQTAEKSVTKTIINEDTSVLQPRFKKITNINNAKPGDIIRYQIGANARRSRLNDPVIAFLLPKELEYMGNVTASYSDYFGGADEVTTPEPTVISNVNENSDSAVIFEFDYNFRQKSIIAVEFDTKVKVGAIKNIPASMLLGTASSNSSFLNSFKTYEDSFGIYDGIAKYAWSNYVNTSIIYIAMYKLDKKVKGIFDDEYVEEPIIASTLDGAEFMYKLSVENVGNVDFDSIEIVDILPHIGDNGVINVKNARKSEFDVHTVSEVIPSVKTGFAVYYSQSTDPVRFGGSFDKIGTDNDWNGTAPKDLSLIKSIKIKTNKLVLLPNQKIEYYIKMLTPVGVPAESTAWNSFAANISYINENGISTKLLASEPEKVGIKVISVEEGKGTISGKVWLDSENSGVNDIGIVLYTETGNLVGITFTNTDYFGNDGVFKFSNLENNRYFLKYFIDDKYEFINDKSKSGIIDLARNMEFNNISKGLVFMKNLTPQQIVEVNDSSRRTLRNVIYNQMLLTMKNEDVKSLIVDKN